MKLTNMKLGKKEVEKMTEPSKMDAPAYPYGLTLRLDNEAIEKLGMDIPKTGKECYIYAKAKVISTHISDSAGGEKNSSVELQITDMAIEPVENEKKDTAKKLYGE